MMVSGQRRLLRLEEIIGECRDENKKVLIFSQFRQVLQLCKMITRQETPVIHGDVPLSKRAETTRRFQDADGFAVLVMQIDIGGVGLNLQAASVVILMEPRPSTPYRAQASPRRHGG
jgi:SNF2 family DNA or RNA helicase